MKLLYAKRFSKDVDGIQKEAKIKKDLVKVIENIREAGSLAELKGSGRSLVIENIVVSDLEITGSE